MWKQNMDRTIGDENHEACSKMEGDKCDAVDA